MGIECSGILLWSWIKTVCLFPCTRQQAGAQQARNMYLVSFAWPARRQGQGNPNDNKKTCAPED
jgi:hypothetical protein